MATWHFREYLLCKIDRQSAEERDTSLEASLAQLDEREEHCVQEFWANLDISKPEMFAQETVLELLAGKVVVQAYPSEGQSAWRAALGPQTALEFHNALLRALKEGVSTLCSVKKMNINHVAACSKWPLRMYLRLQRHAHYGFEIEEKLQILLKREREELVGVCETFSEFEIRCLHALLFWFRPKLIWSHLLILVWFAWICEIRTLESSKRKVNCVCDLTLHDVTWQFDVSALLCSWYMLSDAWWLTCQYDYCAVGFWSLSSLTLAASFFGLHLCFLTIC